MAVTKFQGEAPQWGIKYMEWRKIVILHRNCLLSWKW